MATGAAWFIAGIAITYAQPMTKPPSTDRGNKSINPAHADIGEVVLLDLHQGEVKIYGNIKLQGQTDTAPLMIPGPPEMFTRQFRTVYRTPPRMTVIQGQTITLFARMNTWYRYIKIHHRHQYCEIQHAYKDTTNITNCTELQGRTKILGLYNQFEGGVSITDATAQDNGLWSLYIRQFRDRGMISTEPVINFTVWITVANHHDTRQEQIRKYTRATNSGEEHMKDASMSPGTLSGILITLLTLVATVAIAIASSVRCIRTPQDDMAQDNPTEPQETSSLNPHDNQ